jgi:hypothetical protein
LNDAIKSIATLLPKPRLLPNESEAEFQSSLQGLLYELDNHKLIRYQRNAISRLSKAIRPA